MKIEVHKLKEMFFVIPTIGIDIEYKCVFIALFNITFYIGKGK